MARPPPAHPPDPRGIVRDRPSGNHSGDGRPRDGGPGRGGGTQQSTRLPRCLSLEDIHGYGDPPARRDEPSVAPTRRPSGSIPADLPRRAIPVRRPHHHRPSPSRLGDDPRGRGWALLGASPPPSRPP